jgi:hypothetical protein
MTMVSCTACGGEGWVCEEHPDHPWGDEDCCGAPGMPCLECNTAEPPFAPPGSVEVWRMPGTLPMPEAPL